MNNLSYAEKATAYSALVLIYGGLDNLLEVIDYFYNNKLSHLLMLANDVLINAHHVDKNDYSSYDGIINSFKGTKQDIVDRYLIFTGFESMTDREHTLFSLLDDETKDNYKVYLSHGHMIQKLVDFIDLFNEQIDVYRQLVDPFDDIVINNTRNEE